MEISRKTMAASRRIRNSSISASASTSQKVTIEVLLRSKFSQIEG